MLDSTNDEVFRRLDNLPEVDPPPPWTWIEVAHVGGVFAAGFVPATDDLLVVSHNGRGLFDCRTGEKIARERSNEYDGLDDSQSTALGIGRDADVVVPIAGLYGGELIQSTSDGWSIEVVRYLSRNHYGYEHAVFLASNGRSVFDENVLPWKLWSDDVCEFWAAGFSPTGRSLVVVTSCELVISGRRGAE